MILTEKLIAQIGDHLRQKRLTKNLSQADLALRAGISRRTVQAIERGESISLSNFIELLRTLDETEFLQSFADTPQISPLMLAKHKGKMKLRAGKAKSLPPSGEYLW